MSKPINVEAQRVHKVLAECSGKLKVLSLLNSEFFEEIRKKDPNEIVNHFGPQVGPTVLKQAALEEDFANVCVEDGVKMTPLDDPYIPEEARKCALDLKDNITKLIRMFSIRENQLKLKAYEHKSVEFASFIDSFNNLQKLMTNKLNTQMEEVKQINQQRTMLGAKTEKLQDIRDQKKESYDKYCEDCGKSKEQRDAQKKILIGQITSENSNRDQVIGENVESGTQSEDQLKENHEATVKKLKTDITKYEKELDNVMKKNSKNEMDLRKEYKKSANTFIDNMNTYDFDLKNQTRENQKVTNEYNETLADLAQMKEEYNMLLEEKRKRDEIAAIMQMKNDEQNASMDKLIKASEFIQAHWRGLQDRRLMEKARKGKKKKKKKK